jgi:hypothetical protein
MIGAPGEAVGASPSASPDGNDPFAALDAREAASATTWIHAGARRAEAGYEDPALGWVGVRAELGGGGIHAAVVPGSSQAAQELGNQMAGLNSYLAEHRAPVESVTVAAPEDRWAGPGTGPGTGQGAGQGAGQGSDSGANPGMGPGTGGNSGQEAEGGARALPQSSAPTGAQAIAAPNASDGNRESDATQAMRTDGVSISVIA